MNEQFEKLRNEAFRLTEWETLDYDSILEKFGELIVKKCIDEIEFQYGGGNLMEDDTHNPEWDKAVECVSAMVRHRFGIK